MGGDFGEFFWADDRGFGAGVKGDCVGVALVAMSKKKTPLLS